MTNYAALEVCMFRIFASYGSPEKAKLWFEAQGLEDAIIETYDTPTDVITRVRVGNLTRETNKIYVSKGLLSAMIGKRLIYGEEFSATWHANGKLRGVLYQTSSL